MRECLDDAAGSGEDRPVLVGHSFGGRVAVRLAATSPELVRGIVLTGVPLLRPETPAAKPALGFRVLRFLNKWDFISNDLMEKERRKRGSADYRAAEGELREVLVKAVNEDYGEPSTRCRRTGCRWRWSGVSTTRPRRRRWPSAPGTGSARTPTWSSCPGSAHLLDDGLLAALRTAIDATAAER